jgi:hypothetical protein
MLVHAIDLWCVWETYCISVGRFLEDVVHLFLGVSVECDVGRILVQDSQQSLRRRSRQRELAIDPKKENPFTLLTH